MTQSHILSGREIPQVTTCTTASGLSFERMRYDGTMTAACAISAAFGNPPELLGAFEQSTIGGLLRWRPPFAAADGIGVVLAGDQIIRHVETGAYEVLRESPHHDSRARSVLNPLPVEGVDDATLLAWARDALARAARTLTPTEQQDFVLHVTPAIDRLATLLDDPAVIATLAAER